MDHTAGITFDCQGHRINGVDYGISITEGSDDRIRGCDIAANNVAIEINYSRNITVSDNTLTGSTYGSIKLYHSNDSLINNNTLRYPQRSGVYVSDSNRNTISSNELYVYGPYLSLTAGLVIGGSDNLIIGNDVWAGMGLWIWGGNTIISNMVCNHTGLNYDIWGGAGTSGSNNTCDLTNGYNDPGYIGCTRTCSGENGTATTTSTSTTSTTQEACVMPGNYPPCGAVELSEVVSAINLWADGIFELGGVVDLINSWADPEHNPPN
jgi:parallel beta-helix repeat protein